MSASTQVTPSPFATPAHTQQTAPGLSLHARGVLRRLEAGLRGTRVPGAFRLPYPITDGVSYTSPAPKPLMRLPWVRSSPPRRGLGPMPAPARAPLPPPTCWSHFPSHSSASRETPPDEPSVQTPPTLQDLLLGIPAQVTPPRAMAVRSGMQTCPAPHIFTRWTAQCSKEATSSRPFRR